MFAVRSLIRNNAGIVKNVAQQRNMSGVAIPARNKVSKGEVIFLASVMVLGWCAVPAWVLCNMKNYREHE